MATPRDQSLRAERSRWRARGMESHRAASRRSRCSRRSHPYRQRVVERLLAVPSQALLTPRLFDLSARRLKELPSAIGTRIEFVPRSGLAELRAHVVERPLIPSDPWSYAALGLVAAARKEVSLSTGALTGGGERISVGWRFWPDRPRVNAEIVAPARVGRAVGRRWIRASANPSPTTRFRRLRRSGGGAGVSNWITSWARVSARLGLDAWEDRGKYGVASAGLRLASAHDRLTVGIDGSNWMGEDSFGLVAASVRLRSRDDHRGRVFIVRGGGAVATESTPPISGSPAIRATSGPRCFERIRSWTTGMLESERLGRRIAHVSGEVRQWWTLRSFVHVGAAAFADAAHVESRADA